MDALDIIRQLCKSRGITITQVENDLGYSNGSITKVKSMSADRLYQISQYFNVSMEYLMTGKTITETDDEMSLLRQQQSILMEINKISQAMAQYYKEISKCQERLTKLKKEYNELDSKKKEKGQNENQGTDDFIDIPPFDIDEELPFN